jgi:hypothetical protein
MTELNASDDLGELGASEAITNLNDLAIDRTTGDFLAAYQRELGNSVRRYKEGQGEHERLINDRMSNPVGVAERLSALPDLIDIASSGGLDNAGTLLDVIGLHIEEAATHFDGLNEGNLRDELRLLTAHAGQNDGTLARLVQDVRYASILASPYGKALCANLGQDYGAIRAQAIRTNGANGTPLQQRAARGLAKMTAARRTHFLVTSGAKTASGAIRARNAARGFDRGYNGPSSPEAIRSDAKARAFRS